MKKRMLAVLLISCLCAACTREQAAPPAASAVPETEPAAADFSPGRIEPLPCTLDLNRLDSCTLAVSMEEEDLTKDAAGNLQLHLTVYVYDLYDAADISRMRVGDILCINRQALPVTALEETPYGSVLINGGLDHGGHELRTEGGGVYFETGYSDVRSYYRIGSVTLPLSSDFVYIDASDPDADAAVRSVEEFEESYRQTAIFFQPSSTGVLVENGVITSLTRIYVP